VPLPSGRSIVPLVAFAVFSPIALAAQQPQKVKLGAPETEFSESFDHITALRELSDGRLIVSDAAAKTISLVDMKRKSVTAIGREGQGPKEFSMPGALLPMPGDTTFMADFGQQRFLRIAPNGTPVDVVLFPSWLGFGGGGAIAADRNGRIYAIGQKPPTLGAATATKVDQDTLPLLRWDRTRKSADTVAWVVDAPMKRVQAGNAITVMPVAFGGQDMWSVAADGRLGIARVADYHVEWLGGAKRVAGAPVAYDRIKVTSADKDEIRKQYQDVANKMTIVGPVPSGTKLPKFQMPVPEFAEYKAPFISARATPDGQLWVQRTKNASTGALYDVFDGQGRLIRQVELPKKTRLAGFGARSMYLARADEDGLEWLGRYPRP